MAKKWDRGAPTCAGRAQRHPACPTGMEIPCGKLDRVLVGPTLCAIVRAQGKHAVLISGYLINRFSLGSVC